MVVRSHLPNTEYKLQLYLVLYVDWSRDRITIETCHRDVQLESSRERV